MLYCPESSLHGHQKRLPRTTTWWNVIQLICYFVCWRWLGVFVRRHESYCHRKRDVNPKFRTYPRPSCWYSRCHIKKSQQSPIRSVYIWEFIRFNEVKTFLYPNITGWPNLLQIYRCYLSSNVADIWAGFVPTFHNHPSTRYWPYVVKFFVPFESRTNNYSNRIRSLYFPSSCPNARFTHHWSSPRWIPKHPNLPAHARELAAKGEHSWPSPST